MPELDPNTLEKSLSSVERSLASDELPELDDVEAVVDVSEDESDELSPDVELSELLLELEAPMTWASALSAPPRSP